MHIIIGMQRNGGSGSGQVRRRISGKTVSVRILKIWIRYIQWRRQDLLRGGAKTELELCHGTLTADFRAGCTSCSMTNSFVTNTVLTETAVTVSCWSLHHLISQTTQYLEVGSPLGVTPKWSKNETVGDVPQCPVAGDRRYWVYP